MSMPCPDCGSTASIMRENGTLEVCKECGFILWEDMDS